MYSKILWSGFLATVGILTAVPSATAHNDGSPPHHDSGGYSTGNIVVTPVASPTGSRTQFNPTDGTISGGIINSPIELGSSSGSGLGSGSSAELGSSSGSGLGSGSSAILGSGSGSGSGAGDGTITTETGEGQSSNTALGKGECTTLTCLSAKDSPQDISLNDAAELLENSLDASAENLAAAEEQSRIAANTRRNALDKEVRHITRNSNSCPNSDCHSPTQANQIDKSSVTEVREVLERQIAESQKFIEQVNLIDPEKNLW